MLCHITRLVQPGIVLPKLRQAVPNIWYTHHPAANSHWIFLLCRTQASCPLNGSTLRPEQPRHNVLLLPGQPPNSLRHSAEMRYCTWSIRRATGETWTQLISKIILEDFTEVDKKAAGTTLPDTVINT